MKICSKCKVSQELTEFGSHNHTRDRKDSWCKSCRRIISKTPRRVAMTRVAEKKRRAANPDKVKDSTLKLKFGITLLEYRLMLKEQNSCCKICKKPETARDSRNNKLKDLAVDHNHFTNEIRGLLCERCNTSIGKFHDDPILIRKAAQYLDDCALGRE